MTSKQSRSARGGQKAERGKASKPGGSDHARSKAKLKKPMKSRMTREADERIRAATSRRVSASTTKRSATFVLDVATAADVAVAGTFNNWLPQPMAQGRDGLWRVTVPLTPGTHQYKFLVDSEWREDPNNPRKVLNEFGGFNSICEVL